MKTAISIPDDLFRKVEEFSSEHGISRSEVFARAVEEYFEKRRSWELLEAVNRACDQGETSEEVKVRKGAGKRYAKILSGEPY
ncbi:MAG: CopG family transcriptional regulator [bacterium]|nr:CopG family transcriptional regulator [bacterium]